MNSRLTCLLLLALGAIASGCSHVESGAQASTAAPAPPPVPAEAGQITVAAESLPYIEVRPATRDARAAIVRAPGRVTFKDGGVASVAAPIQGRVVAIHAKLGEQVKAGDPLVVLQSPDAAAARSALAAALVARAAAQAALDRQSGMLEKGVGIASDKAVAEAELAKARAEVESAERAASYLGSGGGATVTVRAPIAGTVLERKATVGAVAEPNGDALMTLGDPSALWVTLDVFERDLPAISGGAKVTLQLASLDAPVTGHVASIGGAMSSGLRSAPVNVELDHVAAGLRAGMFARADVEAEATTGVTLPVSAVLIKDGTDSLVYVAKDAHTFVPREVKVGSPQAGYVQVTSGLAVGEPVVMRGALLLDGAADQLL